MIKSDHFQNCLVQMIIFQPGSTGSLKQWGEGGKTGVCRGTSPCPFLNGNNTDYKQGAKMVQDIKAVKTGCAKCRQKCCVIELSYIKWYTSCTPKYKECCLHWL